MGRYGLAALYTAAALCANAAIAEGRSLAELREGDMRKLNVHETPVAGSDIAFEAANGEEIDLSAYAGQHVILNFWATWCAPCRKEMPQLSQLQDEFGGDALQVVTVATGRNPPDAMAAFFEEIGVDNLPLHRDPRMSLSRSMGVLGLPVTVILDPDGREIARLQGDADWYSDSARAIAAQLVGAEPVSPVEAPADG